MALKTKTFEVDKRGGKHRTTSKEILQKLQKDEGAKARVSLVNVDWANRVVTYDVK